jgi:hypothetical protein
MPVSPELAYPADGWIKVKSECLKRGRSSRSVGTIQMAVNIEIRGYWTGHFWRVVGRKARLKGFFVTAWIDDPDYEVSETVLALLWNEGGYKEHWIIAAVVKCSHCGFVRARVDAPRLNDEVFRCDRCDKLYLGS